MILNTTLLRLLIIWLFKTFIIYFTAYFNLKTLRCTTHQIFLELLNLGLAMQTNSSNTATYD